jgi:hypothetical protein
VQDTAAFAAFFDVGGQRSGAPRQPLVLRTDAKTKQPTEL